MNDGLRIAMLRAALRTLTPFTRRPRPAVGAPTAARPAVAAAAFACQLQQLQHRHVRSAPFAPWPGRAGGSPTPFSRGPSPSSPLTRSSGRLAWPRAAVADVAPPRAHFRTNARLLVHPALWLVLKPFTKIWIVLWGRFFRKWWKAAPAEERKHLKALARDSWHVLASLLLIATALFGVYYVAHLQVCPISGRRRFVVLTPEQMLLVAEAERDTILETHKSALLPADHEASRHVSGIVKKVVEANSDLGAVKSTRWQVTLIHDESMLNAMVLPTGDIFVFTGLFKIVRDENQLAIVLAHEMSHVLLSHSAEHLSLAQLLDFTVIAVMAALWLFLPNDGIAWITQWFYSKVLKIGAELPFSRFMENEADEVGLLMAAKACYDIRQGPAFWSAMNDLVKKGDDIEMPTLLSTHPAHGSRTENLLAMMPEALRLREQCGCPALVSLPKEIAPDILPTVTGGALDHPAAHAKRPAKYAALMATTTKSST